MDPTVTAAAIGAGSTVAAAVASGVLGRRWGRRTADLERASLEAQVDAAQAQAAQAISAAAAGLVSPLTAQVTALSNEVAALRPLRERVAHLERENEELREQVSILQAQVDVYARERHA